jgi:threonine/homoserine/homoserine lactone efflux protein
MMESLLLGGGFAFGAAVQPGPLQAFLLSRVTALGWRRTLPACLAPLLSDGPIAVVVLLALDQVAAATQHLLTASGGVLLLYLAWGAFRQARWPGEHNSQGSPPRTLLQAALVNALNPNPYLGWALVLGPAVLKAWRRQPVNAIALVVAFYSVMVVMLALFIVLAGATRWLSPGGRRSLGVASAAVLALLGAYLFITGLRSLTEG